MGKSDIKFYPIKKKKSYLLLKLVFPVSTEKCRKPKWKKFAAILLF